ncbi:unnamed protein product, partial [Heterotrigona itama]
HPWETVVKAACRKYPNPLNPHVLGTDVIDRKVKDGVLFSHRLVSSQWRFPKWLTQISLGKHVSVDEVVTYAPHPENPETTLLSQQAVISIQGVPLIDHLERLLTMRIDQNAKKGRQAVEWVIEKFQSEMKDMTDDLFSYTKQGMEDLQNVAKKSFDEFQNLTVPPPSQSIP